MYCESKISHVYYGDIEHIRPKSIYPHLEFKWENLGYICAKCNGEKSNKFDEECCFINPYEEDPSEFITALGETLWHFKGNEKGEYTIKEIGLNRPDLIVNRRERLTAISNLIDKIARTQTPSLKKIALQELDREIEADKAYSMVVRACVKNLTREY